MRRVVPAALLAILVPGVLLADAGPRLDRKVGDAVRALDEFLGARDSEIPRDLVADAQCVVVVPDVGKGAFIVGGRYGKGLAACRLPEGGWSPPAFVEIGGISVGLQVGGELMDLLVVVRNRTGADYLLRDRFTLGADASVAAGPVGRTAGAATDAALKASILIWSRSRGAFAGLAVDGAVLKQDKSDNKRSYGRRVTAREILMPEPDAILETPDSLAPFTRALVRVARR